MNKAKVNYFIDILLIICLVVVGVTGVVLFFFFPSGEPGVGRFVTFIGTSKHDWTEPHEFFGMAMVFLMLVHLILHFNWLKCMTGSFLHKKKH